MLTGKCYHEVECKVQDGKVMSNGEALRQGSVREGRDIFERKSSGRLLNVKII